MNRLLPAGLAPYGMPLKTLMPSCTVPRTLPDDVSTGSDPLAADKGLACFGAPGIAAAEADGRRAPACVPATSNDACLRNWRRPVPVSWFMRSSITEVRCGQDSPIRTRSNWEPRLGHVDSSDIPKSVHGRR